MTTIIDHTLPFIAQDTSSNCWQAALSMLLDGRPVDSAGAALTSDGGLVISPPNLRVLANAYNLRLVFGQTLEHAAMEDLLQHGPIMVCGFMPGAVPAPVNPTAWAAQSTMGHGWIKSVTSPPARPA